MTTLAHKIFYNGKISTLDVNRPEASAVAIADDRILFVGDDKEVMDHKRTSTELIDLKGRRVVPGLIDSHMHVIRGGLNYNMELRWDGVPSLSIAMQMLKEQARRTPAPQWVRVVGGFTAHQFHEKRLPTLKEINDASPDTPVFILHLYDRALLNRAALQVCGITKDTPNPPGGLIERDRNGNPTGMLIAKPNAMILYATLAKGPKLPIEYQINSTKHFMRELNRLGVTGVIDAGGGFQNYPEDYEVIKKLSDSKELTLRIAYNLFTQKPKEELQDFERWTSMVQMGAGDSFYKHNGAGEMLVFSAADFEDFREPRPDLSENLEAELEKVVRLLAEKKWAFRMHATYDETIDRALNVFEKVSRDVPIDKLNWFFDHAETISDRNIDRVKALGGGIAVQHRMAYQGEYFIERYGRDVARNSPPIRKMLKYGVPVGGGTDATRVASYNPWVSLYWLVTGKTVSGTKLYPDENCLSRMEALKLWTVSNTWFSREEGIKGKIAPGLLADFIALSDDYFQIDEENIKDLYSVLTVVGGKIVHGSDNFLSMSPDIPKPMPDWSPVSFFGGYQDRQNQERYKNLAPLPHQTQCTLHSDWSHGCMCWAF